MDKKFYDKVIESIPSRSLKDFIGRSGFVFGERDLLRIIVNHAPSYGKRLSLLDEAASKLCDRDMRRLAEKRLVRDKKQYDLFMTTDADTVYEIEIKTDPHAADEGIYLARSFDEAVAVIKSFIKAYGIKARERTAARYTLRKNTVRLPERASDIKNCKVGASGECVLDDKFEILDLQMYQMPPETSCKSGAFCCDECRRCIGSTVTHFPHFLRPYDLVAYYDDPLYDPSHLEYGVFYWDMERDDTDSYVVSLDSACVSARCEKYADGDGVYYLSDAHSHPSYFAIEKVERSDVPRDILDAYDFAVEVLKKTDEAN